MALSYTQAQTVSSNYFDKTITQQVYEKSPLFAKLKKENKVKQDGGNQLQFPIRYSKLDVAKAVDAREQIIYEQKDTRTAGVLDWKYYIGNSVISWDERVKNTGKAQIVNLIKDKTEELMDDIYYKFESDLYATTQASKSFSSLDTIVSQDTYAGIEYADVSDWAGQLDTSTTVVTLYNSSGALANMINTATFGKNKPKLIITTRDLFSKVESLIEPQQRYYDSGTLGKIGFTTIQFHGIEIVADYACPSGYMYGLDTENLEFRYHPDWDMKVEDWKSLEQAGYPNAMVKIVSCALNLLCRMRQTNFKYSALDYTA